VGTWSPVISVEVVPVWAGGDSAGVLDMPSYGRAFAGLRGFPSHMTYAPEGKTPALFSAQANSFTSPSQSVASTA
jgi:hypothetical protein